MPPVPVNPSPRRPGKRCHRTGTNSEHDTGRKGGDTRPRCRERVAVGMDPGPPVAGLNGRRGRTGALPMVRAGSACEPVSPDAPETRPQGYRQPCP